MLRASVGWKDKKKPFRRFSGRQLQALLPASSLAFQDLCREPKRPPEHSVDWQKFFLLTDVPRYEIPRFVKALLDGFFHSELQQSTGGVGRKSKRAAQHSHQRSMANLLCLGL
jgi:hypothetical protein